MKRLLALLLVMWAAGAQATVVDDYLERYFKTFPTRATAEGLHHHDRRLEDLAPEARQEWIAYNHELEKRVSQELAAADLGFQDRLDLELLHRQIERQLLDWELFRRPERNPLFWTDTLGNATVYLLARDDLPEAERLDRAAERATLIPRLALQARQALAGGDPSQIAPELAAMAARQAGASAVFYRQGFAAAAPEGATELRRKMTTAGLQAAAALEELAEFLGELEKEATGSVHLGENYALRFRTVTGIEQPVSDVLAGAETDLAAKLRETAKYGREVWPQIFPDTEPPAEDRALLERLMKRVGEDRAATVEEYVEDWRGLIRDSIEFVRRHDVITLPEPLTLHVGRSPSFFIGQSVGGVYPAGPYAPADAKTLLFLPTPSDEATPEQREAFFRDFNHHFNVMITPHELIPGHSLQLKFAARHPHKVRALFGDGVYIEGWGTFCERLMLDLGWGGPLDRLAHLKKQLENIARTIVDIRVHTRGMTRDEVLAFVEQEALQDEQFAANMWRRAITSSPQLTSYHLGYRQVWDLYQDLKTARGQDFQLKDFMDGMMELGPVPVKYYRQRMLD
ncbi:MAG: DUF885 domain-containing protein [Acidobacteria bacterium]|nr:MAG: DUF885 domain-containing protein [Acidobacteriota bacterium]